MVMFFPRTNREGDVSLSALKSHVSVREAVKVLNAEQLAILLLSLVTDVGGEVEDNEIIPGPIQTILN